MPTYAEIHGQRASGRTADVQPDRTTMRILVIEDDRDAADYLIKAFREVGHVADAATDGEDGLAMALGGEYDVLIVDRMLPKIDGLVVIGTLRDKGIETPALILSALGQVDDRVKGLRAGGDDYLPKPYSFSELLARVEVLARRRGGRSEETVLRVGDLEIDLSLGSLLLGDRRLGRAPAGLRSDLREADGELGGMRRQREQQGGCGAGRKEGFEDHQASLPRCYPGRRLVAWHPQACL